MTFISIYNGQFESIRKNSNKLIYCMYLFKVYLEYLNVFESSILVGNLTCSAFIFKIFLLGLENRFLNVY